MLLAKWVDLRSTEVKASTSLTGSFQADRDYKQEEQAVDAASIALEEFHAKLGHFTLH